MFKRSTLNNRAIYFRLLSYVKPYWKGFGIAVLGMVAIATTEPAFPAIMKYLLDQGFKTEDPRMVWLIPVGIVALFLVRGIFSFVTSYLMTWTSTRLITDLRREMFAKILVLPAQVYHDQSPGKLISRLIYDVGQITEAATGVLITIVRESLTALALIAYLLYLDWKLTLITLAIGPRNIGKWILVWVPHFPRILSGMDRHDPAGGRIFHLGFLAPDFQSLQT